MSRFAEFYAKLDVPQQPADTLRTLADLSEHIRSLQIEASNYEEGARCHVLFCDTLAWVLSKTHAGYDEAAQFVDSLEVQSAELPS